MRSQDDDADGMRELSAEADQMLRGLLASVVRKERRAMIVACAIGSGIAALAGAIVVLLVYISLR